MSRALLLEVPSSASLMLRGRSVLEWCARACDAVPNIEARLVLAAPASAGAELAAACAKLSGLSHPIEVSPSASGDGAARLAAAARDTGADLIARVRADQPFIDAAVIAAVFAMVERAEADYGANDAPASFPDGMDVQVFTRDLLARAAMEGAGSDERADPAVYARNHRSLRTARLVGPGGAAARWNWRVRGPQDAARLEPLAHIAAEAAGASGAWRVLLAACANDPALAEASNQDCNIQRTRVRPVRGSGQVISAA